MVDLNNTFKIVITNNDETKEETILTGPIVFSITTSPEGTNNFRYNFELREYSNDYNVDDNQLAKEAEKFIKALNRDKIKSIGAYFLTVSDDYRQIFERNIDNIEEITFEYNNDIGDKAYASKYQTVAKLNINYINS